MAKGKTPPAATATAEAPAATGTENGAAEATAPKKAKKERLFTPSTDYTEIRKAEGKLSAKFNRVGRQVKALGMSPEATDTILSLIKSEFDIQVKGVVANVGSTEGAELV